MIVIYIDDLKPTAFKEDVTSHDDTKPFKGAIEDFKMIY